MPANRQGKETDMSVCVRVSVVVVVCVCVCVCMHAHACMHALNKSHILIIDGDINHPRDRMEWDTIELAEVVLG